MTDIRKIVNHVAEKAGRPLAVEVRPLQNFFTAEEYHQKYLDKNPGGYCHINPAMMHIHERIKKDNFRLNVNTPVSVHDTGAFGDYVGCSILKPDKCPAGTG